MTLSHIAADMRRAANQRPGRLHPHLLQRGLRITIQRQGQHLTLTAARPGVYPSDEECKIVTAAQIADALDMSLGNVGAHISNIRKSGITIIGSNTRPTHYHIP